MPEHELSPGANSLELFRQGDDQEQEAAVTFQVVDPLPWPLPPGTDAREGTSTEETCWKNDATCSRRTCIHRVADTCIIYDDTWARGEHKL